MSHFLDILKLDELNFIVFDYLSEVDKFIVMFRLFTLYIFLKEKQLKIFKKLNLLYKI